MLIVAHVTVGLLSYIHCMRDPQLSLVPPEVAIENQVVALHAVVLPQAPHREAASPSAHARHSGCVVGKLLQDALTSSLVELVPSVRAQTKWAEHRPLYWDTVVVVSHCAAHRAASAALTQSAAEQSPEDAAEQAAYDSLTKFRVKNRVSETDVFIATRLLDGQNRILMNRH